MKMFIIFVASCYCFIAHVAITDAKRAIKSAEQARKSPDNGFVLYDSKVSASEMVFKLYGGE